MKISSLVSGRSILAILAIGLFAGGGANTAFSAVVAADNALDSAYSADGTGAWKGINPTVGENPPGSDNGGYGFQPWNFAGGYHDPTVSPYGTFNHFIDGVDFPHSSFNNLAAPAFGLTNANVANFGFTARATRVFAQPLAVGGSFSVEFDNPLLAPLKNNDNTGFIIRLNSGSGPKLATNPNVFERFGLFAFYGFNQGDWNRVDSSGTNDTGLSPGATTVGSVFRLTLLTPEMYSLAVLPKGSQTPLYVATGSLANTGMGNIDTLEIVLFGNGSGNGLTGSGGLPTGQREFFFNNLVLDNPPTFVAGDYNRNGAVDAADFLLWRVTIGDTVTIGSGADGNSDGVVNELDYAVWRQHFGAVSGNGMGAVAAVPEPSSMIAGAIFFAGWRSRRR